MPDIPREHCFQFTIHNPRNVQCLHDVWSLNSAMEQLTITAALLSLLFELSWPHHALMTRKPHACELSSFVSWRMNMPMSAWTATLAGTLLCSSSAQMSTCYRCNLTHILKLGSFMLNYLKFFIIVISSISPAGLLIMDIQVTALSWLMYS